MNKWKIILDLYQFLYKKDFFLNDFFSHLKNTIYNTLSNIKHNIFNVYQNFRNYVTKFNKYKKQYNPSISINLATIKFYSNPNNLSYLEK